MQNLDFQNASLGQIFTTQVTMVHANELYYGELAWLPQYNTNITAMVDKSYQAALIGSINDIILVHPKQVAAYNTSYLVSLLSAI